MFMILRIFSIIVISLNTIFCFYKLYKENDMKWICLGLPSAFALALIIKSIIR